MAQVELDTKEIKDFLTHIITNNRAIQAKGLVPTAVEITGEAGLGKTSVALKLGEELGIDVVKVNLSQIEDLGDLVGYPVKQFQMIKAGVTAPATVVAGQTKTVIVEKKMPNGQIIKIKKTVPVDATKTTGSNTADNNANWIDEQAVQQYASLGYTFTGKKRMSYAPPEWIADRQGGGLLILDDYTRADQRFLQATMEIIDRQEYISWKLPKDWHILLTTNPDDGNYLVNAIDDAQKTRFISVFMKWSAERWAEWAEIEGIDGRSINFVLMNPEIVTPKVNPRAITTFFNAISSFPKFEDELPMIQMIGEGSVGPEVATLYTTFINNRLDKLLTPKDILLGKDDAVVGKALLTAICDNGTTADYRADIASILTTRLINFAVNYANENTIRPEHIQRLVYLVTDPDILTDDLKYHLVKKVLNGNKQKFQKLLFNTTVQEYATK